MCVSLECVLCMYLCCVHVSVCCPMLYVSFGHVHVRSVRTCNIHFYSCAWSCCYSESFQVLVVLRGRGHLMKLLMRRWRDLYLLLSS